MKNDKKKHLLAGFLIAFITTLVLGFLINPTYALLIGWGASGVAGLAKELIYDKWMGKGTPELLDLWVTFLAGFGGSWVAIFIVEVIL